MGQNPPGFIVGNADVNGDGFINVLDIIAIVNIIMGGGKTSVISEPADIFLSPGLIRLQSDGTLAGLQFELIGTQLHGVDLRIVQDGYQLVFNIVGDKLLGIIYHPQNTPIPAGTVDLINIVNHQALRWGKVSGANTNPDKVAVNTHGSIAEEFFLEVFPNPNIGAFTARFRLPVTSRVQFSLVDMTGRCVYAGINLAEAVYDKGTYSIDFLKDPTLVRGIHMLQLNALPVNEPGRIITKRVKVVIIE
ncbi:MAG: hypothetical protein U1C46_05715 [Bacteroidales bacterium]|nr:hypothetical protein [Bacteroidales bacterium]MDZ4204299.1 hypothetical protein [Bacteroidales bacterium]